MGEHRHSILDDLFINNHLTALTAAHLFRRFYEALTVLYSLAKAESMAIYALSPSKLQFSPQPYFQPYDYEMIC
jgi:hypothetical protein